MNDDDPDDRLIAIAEAIARGEQVSWTDAARAAAGDEPRLVDALRSLEGIAGAQRRLLDEAEQDGLTHWAHLAIVERTASGDGWATYRARDAALARDLSLLLVGPLGGHPAVVERLLQDARRRTELHHPHLATVYGADYAQDRVGVWSDWIDGEPLERAIAAHGPFAPHEAASIVRDLCSAAAAVHQAGLVHGAIRHASVTRTADGRIVLQPWLDRGPSTTAASDVAGLGGVLRALLAGTGGPPQAVAYVSRRHLRKVERIAERAESTDPVLAFGSVAALDAALAAIRPPASIGVETVVGFLAAALVVATILWITSSIGTTP